MSLLMPATLVLDNTCGPPARQLPDLAATETNAMHIDEEQQRDRTQQTDAQPLQAVEATLVETPSDTQPQLQCSRCPKRFFHNESLVAHERVHQINALAQRIEDAKKKAFSCPQCGKQFSSVYAFEQHKFLHRVQDMRSDTGAVNAATTEPEAFVEAPTPATVTDANVEGNGDGAPVRRGISEAAAAAAARFVGMSSAMFARPLPPPPPAQPVPSHKGATAPRPRPDQITQLFTEYERRFAHLDHKDSRNGNVRRRQRFEHADASLANFLCEHTRPDSRDAFRFESPFPTDALFNSCVRPIVFPYI